MAYQIMAILMNYARTVSDFGKCKESGRNEYGFPYISNCVGSQTKSCKDSKYPVACSDDTCRYHTAVYLPASYYYFYCLNPPPPFNEILLAVASLTFFSDQPM